jgi:hypothetical protein
MRKEMNKRERIKKETKKENEKEGEKREKEERKKEETQNWIDGGMFITLTFSCFPETKKRRVRGVEDMFTSIITSLPSSFHVEFPSFHL